MDATGSITASSAHPDALPVSSSQMESHGNLKIVNQHSDADKERTIMKRISIKEYLLILVAAVFLAPQTALLACDTGAGESCTPGYWKNQNSLKNWPKTGFSPNDRFNLIFNLNTTFSPTLLDMLSAKGGGGNALGRHAVAALLNASLPNSTYPFAPDEIKTAVNATLSQYQATLFYGADVSTDIDNIESLKDLYEALNQNE